ncbi:uncharacterized protein [Clytia hemisphaerica]|uniref:Nanos-type domain-containing protein n=1 Tax=Clytia hemisphaerica TaxID=252671 RepID=H9CW29_9CNID|nr:Nanos1 [Clytia hemisphaerica]
MIRSRESSLKATLERMDFTEKPQYNVFEDYLGLINLVCPATSTTDSTSSSPIPSPCGSVYDFATESSSMMHRHRMNSLDSDSLSDSSSSGESREDDLMFVYPPPPTKTIPRAPSPPMRAILETPPYPPPSLETLIAQKAVLSRLQQIPMNPGPFHSSHHNRKNAAKATVCVFCRNNGESREFYSSHTLKDSEGNTSCPILRAYTCPLCKANGDSSHTVKYCPKYTPKVKAEKLLHLNLGLHQL